MTTPEPADQITITSVEQLVEHIRRGAKPRDRWGIGVEQERPVVLDDGRPAPVDAVTGAEALLTRLEARGYEGLRVQGHLLEVRGAGDRISLEPGGQVEVAAAPQPTAVACRTRLIEHARVLEDAARPFGHHYLGTGLYPWGTVDDLAWLPKPRYALMRAFLPQKGRLGVHMMKRTATVQVNLDFDDESCAVAKFRTAMGLASVVTALYAASPISEGRPNGYQSYRAAIWLDTDEERCGLLPFVFRDGFEFRDYVEWALDVPMFFLMRDGGVRDVDGITFRRLLTGGWQGTRATLGDWELHLSTLFPEVRLRPYIEMRGADAGPFEMAFALPALWRGLLDAPDALRAAWKLVENVSFDERLRVRQEVPRAGLETRIGGRSLREFAVELCRIAQAGLATLPGGIADTACLAPLVERAESGRTPATEMLDDFAATGGDPARLVERWSLGVPTEPTEPTAAS